MKQSLGGLLLVGGLAGACAPHVDESTTKTSNEGKPSQATKVTRDLTPRMQAELDGDSIEVSIVQDTECQLVATVGAKQVTSGWKVCSTEPSRGVSVQMLVGGVTTEQTTDDSGSAQFVVELAGARGEARRAIIKATVMHATPEGFIDVPLSKALSITDSPAYIAWVRDRDAEDSARRSEQLESRHGREIGLLEGVEGDLPQIDGNWDAAKMSLFANVVNRVTSISGKDFTPAEQDRLKVVSGRVASLSASFKDQVRKMPQGARASSGEQSSQSDAPVAAQATSREVNALRDRCSSGDRSACLMMQMIVTCGKGRSDACDSAGNGYVGGVGVGKDLRRAKDFWLEACQGDARRCVGYAMAFLRTPSFPGNVEIAKEFFDLGCAGDADQCTLVGTLYRRSAPGLPRDDAKAREYFNRACTAGAASGCLSLKNFDRL